MSQNPGQWGPVGSQGQPPAGTPAGGGGYPPAGGQPAQGGYPPQAGYPTQAGYPGPGGYPPAPGPYQPGPYNQPGPYGPTAGYSPIPGGPPPGYGPLPPGALGPVPPPRKKSAGLIIGIVVAAVLLLAAVGGIFIALSHKSADQSTSTITPGPPVEPSSPPTSGPGSQTSAANPPSSQPTSPASGQRVDLAAGISLRVAPGWSVAQGPKAGAVSVSNGDGAFVARVTTVAKGTNPVQLCDSYNRDSLSDATNVDFQAAQAVDVKSSKLAAAVCDATFTQTGSNKKTVQVTVSTMASVRKKDGVTILATLLVPEGGGRQTVVDANAMLSDLLTQQASG